MQTNRREIEKTMQCTDMETTYHCVVCGRKVTQTLLPDSVLYKAYSCKECGQGLSLIITDFDESRLSENWVLRNTYCNFPYIQLGDAIRRLRVKEQISFSKDWERFWKLGKLIPNLQFYLWMFKTIDKLNDGELIEIFNKDVQKQYEDYLLAFEKILGLLTFPNDVEKRLLKEKDELNKLLDQSVLNDEVVTREALERVDKLEEIGEKMKKVVSKFKATFEFANEEKKKIESAKAIVRNLIDRCGVPNVWNDVFCEVQKKDFHYSQGKQLKKWVSELTSIVSEFLLIDQRVIRQRLEKLSKEMRVYPVVSKELVEYISRLNGLRLEKKKLAQGDIYKYKIKNELNEISNDLTLYENVIDQKLKHGNVYHQKEGRSIFYAVLRTWMEQGKRYTYKSNMKEIFPHIRNISNGIRALQYAADNGEILKENRTLNDLNFAQKNEYVGMLSKIQGKVEKIIRYYKMKNIGTPKNGITILSDNDIEFECQRLLEKECFDIHENIKSYISKTTEWLIKERTGIIGGIIGLFPRDDDDGKNEKDFVEEGKVFEHVEAEEIKDKIKEIIRNLKPEEILVLVFQYKFSQETQKEICEKIGASGWNKNFSAHYNKVKEKIRISLMRHFKDVFEDKYKNVEDIDKNIFENGICRALDDLDKDDDIKAKLNKVIEEFKDNN